MNRLRRLLKKLSISAGAVFVASIALELFLRAQEPGPFSFFDRNPYVDSAVDQHVRHKPGFTGRWDSTWYDIDERGLRGASRTPSFDADELRIACVGDSCTFGKGVLDEHTWPRLLETMLDDRGHKAVVWNLGINGAHPRVYREVMREEVDALKPNVVLIGFNINDFPNTIRAVDEKVFRGRSLRTMVPAGLRDSLGRLALYRKARAIYYETQKKRDWEASEATAKAATGAGAIDEALWEKQREYLLGIRDLAAQNGGTTTVFLFPYESQIYLDSYDRTPIDTLAALCTDLGIPFFDLTTGFRKAARATGAEGASAAEAVAGGTGTRLFLSGDRYHPNPLGYSIVADQVLGSMIDQGLVAEATSPESSEGAGVK